jgi:hypothetical protein
MKITALLLIVMLIVGLPSIAVADPSRIPVHSLCLPHLLN